MELQESLNESSKTSKIRHLKKTSVLAVSLILLFLIADATKNSYAITNDIEFTSDLTLADVDQKIKFSWSTILEYQSVIIDFGDGNVTFLDDDIKAIYHAYQEEGIYTVLLYLQYYDIRYNESLVVEVKNYAPKIEINVPITAIENQEVTIGVNILNESKNDIQEGVIKYIYDFGDGTQNTTTSQTILHKWKTAGIYPITITAIDDQGALDQKTKNITIYNFDPDAQFMLGAEIPATYSFTEDIVGSIPFGWKTGTYNSKNTFKVIDGTDSRAKILELNSNENNNPTENFIYKYESNQNFGTIEYQFKTPNPQKVIGYLALKTIPNVDKLRIFTENGEWKYRTNVVVGSDIGQSILIEGDDINPPEANKWYHIRIDFCVSGGIYFGLNEGEFRVIIDGKISQLYKFNDERDPISYISIGTLRGIIGIAYIDSIGLSWDENYNIGDNYHIFESSYYGTYDFRDDVIGTNPQEWSVNETTPHDITVMNMGEDYKEVVQLNDKHNNKYIWIENSLNLYSEDFKDTKNYWDLYNVSDREIIINGVPTDDSFVYSIAPDKNYGLKNNIEIAENLYPIGHFPATYSFDSDIDGTIPSGWEDMTVAGEAKIVNSFNEHSKVAYLRDFNGYYSAWLRNDFPGRTSGEVEFWWAALDSRGVGMSLRYGAYSGPLIVAKDYKYYYVDYYGYEHYVNYGYTSNSWHHHRIVFNTNLNRYYWYIDGNLVGNYIPFRINDLPYIDSVHFHTSGPLYGDIDGLPTYYMHFDAVGYSWDEYYQMGANRNQKTEDHKYCLYKMEFPYLFENATSPSELVTYSDNQNIIDVYHTDDFNEDSVTWNNQPNDKEFQLTSTPYSIGSKLYLYELGLPNYYYKIKNANLNTIGYLQSKESGMEPNLTHYLSKNYQGKGFLYTQTDEEEILNLRSPKNINLDLKPGDKIEIIFNKTTLNKIDFNLLSNGDKIKSFTLSEQGNNNFKNQIALFTINDYITIDQLEFMGLFRDTENLIIDNIRIYRSLTQNISNGTVEFYINTNNVVNKAWSFSLYNDLDVSFSIMIKNGCWMYNSGGITSNIINEYENPVINTWYHVRVDFTFDNSGHQGLDPHQFKIAINGDDRNAIYSTNENIDLINKLRFESGLIDTGISYIDAIGYSWDDKYQIGDNKISVVLYPEKTKVIFSAADTYDTDNDLDSLRYYWNFGDGLSGFGKYVSHDYLTSGRYNVTLYVKDDNGVLDSCSKLVLIFNTLPNITFNNKDKNIEINEGDTIIIDSYSYDDCIDLPLLEYLWNFESDTFNPYYLSKYESGSWRKSYMYTDDFNGKIIGMAQDPEGLYSYDTLNVSVNNVDPLISIYDALIIANFSIKVERSNSLTFGNFTYELVSNENTQFSEFITFLETNKTSVMCNHSTQAIMSISRNWKFRIQSLELLPENSWFRYYINLTYMNGEVLEIDSGKIYGGDYGDWSIDLNQFWYDSENYCFKVPLVLKYAIWDPSEDDITTDISYNSEMTLEINCLDSLPISESFTIDTPLGETTHIIEIYSFNDKIYANISTTQKLSSKAYNNNVFPIYIEDNFTIYPIIDLNTIFIDYLNLNNYVLINCTKANHYINSNVKDDDGGYYNLEIILDTVKCINFKNLCPKIESYVPINNSMNTYIYFNVEISDFDQIHPNYDFGALTYLTDDVPDIPNNFYFTNGTIVEPGDLYFPDNDTTVISSDSDSTLKTIFEDDFNDGIRDPNWFDDHNFGIITETNGTLNLKAFFLSYWGDFFWWNLAWAPYCKTPLYNYSNKDWMTQVYVSDPYILPCGCQCCCEQCCCEFNRHHYGLMLYQDDENVWLFGPYSGGYIKVEKIVNGDLKFVTKVNSSDNYLRIRKTENIYYFEHSNDGIFWSICYNTSIIEILPSDVGVFHKAWFTLPLWVSFDNFKLIGGSSESILNFTTKLNIGDYFNDYGVLENLKILTRYRTDQNALLNLSIYNFLTESWTLIDSSLVNTNFNELIFNISSSDYYNSNYDILVKFESVGSGEQFNLYLDQLRLECKWITSPNVYSCDKKDFNSEDIPSQLNDDIIINSGSLEKIGDLSENDSNYFIFNSEQLNLDLTIQFNLEDAKFFETIDSIDLSYCYKTNIDQLFTLSIYNYTSQEWVLIDSSSYVDFFEGTYSIIPYREERIEIPDQEPIIAIVNDFYDSNLTILLRITGVNQTNDFQLLIDMLKITYTYTPYRFMSSASEPLTYMDGYHKISQLFNYSAEYSSEFSYIYQGVLNFNCTGKYLITVSANDGQMLSKKSKVIEIVKPAPFAKIGNFPNETFEDNLIELNAEIYRSENSTEDLRFLWSFGDNNYAFEKNPTHGWSTSGSYNITLLIVDSYGNSYREVQTIIVKEQTPEIKGPYTFYGIETQAIVLDVEIYDSLLDEINLEYYWYDSFDNLISTDKKPVLILENGEYEYKLIVKDETDKISTANISVIVEDIAPIVLASNYRYKDVYDGTLILRAYGYDTFYDNADLEYYWTIYGTEINNTCTGKYGYLEFACINTTIYKVEVTVIDPDGMVGVTSFIVNCFIDSNRNGYSDEVEYRLMQTNENYEAVLYADSDYDGYTDLFENYSINTDPYDPDMDNDTLLDGYNMTTGIGELTLGTDPRKNDSDCDGLSDPFEFYGWQISTEYYGNITVSSSPTKVDTDNDGLTDFQEFSIGTDPRNPDTDNDGLPDGMDPYPTKYDYDGDNLSDGEEYHIGTLIDSTDTDQDGLSDGEEIIGWGFKTNPLSKDSDHDFLSDNGETHIYTFEVKDRVKMDRSISLLFGAHCEKASSAQISFAISFGEADEANNYGIINVPDLYIEIVKESDKLVLFNFTSNSSRYISKVIDIREIIENNGLDYYDTYTLRINNTIIGCLLEQYKIEVAKYLDPNNNDYDSDGIMDGVESSLIVEGSKKLDFNEYYAYDNLNVDNNTETYNEFTLEIPDVGRVYKADIHVKLKSGEWFTGIGNASVQLVKNEINCSINDVFLIDYFVQFYDQGTYESNPFGNQTEWFFNLTEYVKNHTISEFYGKYVLKIQIEERLVNENTVYNNFTLVDFSINIDTYIEATKDDIQAWITDPAKWDTDGDGWSDSYETYKRGKNLMTNPLSWDSDGDGIKDSKDIDPLHNILLEIILDRGHFGDLPVWYLMVKNPPTMQLSVDYRMSGEDLAFVTPHKDASENTKTKKITIKYYDFIKNEEREKTIWSTKWKSTAIFGQKYYIDIEDDDYDFYMKFKLWDNGIGKTDQFWDTLRMSATFSGDLRDSNYLSGKSFDPNSGTDWLEYTIRTIPLNHANTIAVFGNDTLFNGHYNEKESCHIIQVQVTDNPEEYSPFKYGLNTIIIPNSVFLNTKLNSIVQNETNDHEQLKYSKLANGRFISLNRANLPASASDEIESIFVISCNTTDAEEILTLALTGIINESTGEMGKINDYVSTKNNQYSVEMMNVPYHILSLVPIINNCENDEQGSMPMEAGEWWANQCQAIIDAVVGFFVKAWELFTSVILKVVNEIVKVIVKVIEVIVAAIMWLIELLIKAILLALIWAFFAIMVALLSVIIILIAGIVSILSTMLDISVSTGTTFVHVSGLFMLNFGYKIGEQYDKFVDFKIPTLDCLFETSDVSIKLIMCHFRLFFEILKFPTNILYMLFENNTNKTSFNQELYANKKPNNEINPSFSREIKNENDEPQYFKLEYFIELLANIGDGMGQSGLMYTIVGFGFNKDSVKSIIGGLLLEGAALILWYITTFMIEKDEIKIAYALIGLGIGHLIAFIFAALNFFDSNQFIPEVGYPLSPQEKAIKASLESCERFFEVLGILFDSSKFSDQEIADLRIEIFNAFISLYGGMIGLRLGLFELKQSPAMVSGLCSVVSLFLGLISIGFAIEKFREIQNEQS